ncbi:hypothetical protein FRC12_003673, partial [Ceratobasidium sp. 428]
MPSGDAYTRKSQPPQQPVDGQALRARFPANCSTPFWDPIGAECLCTDSQFQLTDQFRPIGPNGANLTGGGTVITGMNHGMEL